MAGKDTWDEKKRRRMLCLYVSFFFLWSLAVGFMPLGSSLKESTMIGIYIIGTSFWVGMAGTIVMAVRINYCRTHDRVYKSLHGRRRKWGLIHFFQNKKAVMVDLVMFVSVIGIIVARCVKAANMVFFLLFAVGLFSFGMHCMLNDTNYKYLKYNARRDVK